MWQELAKNQIWVCDNFLEQGDLDLVLGEWDKFTSFRTFEQKMDEYYVAPTYYHSRQPKRPPKNKKELQKIIIGKLNNLYSEKFGMIADDDNLTHAQFYFKENEPGVSRYDLHCEPGPNDANSFGQCVFMLYLTDEVDGELICPSERDAEPLFTKTYLESIKTMTVQYVDHTVSVLPKVNRCVVVRNGTPHYVPICSGRRKCVTGWSFLPKKLQHIS